MNDETRIDTASAQPFGTFEETVIVEDRPRRKWWIIGVIAVVLALAAWLMVRSGGAAPAPGDARDAQVPTVTVVTPGRATIE
ncbi:MAG: hypothetical protein ACREBP_10700, partial [Sphingomicrobium sp.]